LKANTPVQHAMNGVVTDQEHRCCSNFALEQHNVLGRREAVSSLQGAGFREATCMNNLNIIFIFSEVMLALLSAYRLRAMTSTVMIGDLRVENKESCRHCKCRYRAF
jgi:hypothetical protein